MDSAKRQRKEQILRYYAREKELEEVEKESLRGRSRQPVIIISESARLKDSAINHELEEISYILKHHSSTISKEDINVAFLQACINGHEDIARLLLEQGASVDYRDTDNWTAAHFASAHGHSSILHLLFEFGADVTLLDTDGNFALDYSENATVRNIIEEEMAQSGVYTEDLPSLRMRQLKAMTAAVRNALLKGKDLTLPNRNGVTPLHTAAAYGYHEVVQLLVESGSIPLSILDESGCTPLYLAMKYKQTQIAKYLLDSGAKMEEASSSEFKLSFERPTEEQSPLPSNQWKLKRASADDAMREKHFLSRYIGVVQDSSRGEGTLLDDDADVPFSEILTGSSDSITRSYIPSTIDNEEEGLREDEGDNYLEDSISERVEELQVKAPTPLQAIPEMIYDTCPKLATPTKATPPLVVEDMYDVAVMPSKPKSKSIYDDDFTLSGFHGNSGRVTPNNEIYNLEADNVDSPSHTPLMKQLVPSKDQDHSPRPTSPSPYETFVSIHSNKMTTPSPTTPTSAPPIPIRRVKDKKNSEPIIARKQTESKKQRSISVDNSISAVGAWLQNFHKKSTPVAPLVLPNFKKPAPKSPVLPPRRMELGQLSPAHTQVNQTPVHSPVHSTSSSPIHLSVQPRARPSSLSPVPLSPNYDADPPPSYATVLHCPEQFSVPGRVESPSPPPVPPHPSHWLVRPQIRQRSEPNNIGFRKSNLRKISSGPLDDRSLALFSSGSDSAIINETTDGEVVRKVIKPYTFRTRFQ